MQTKLNLYIYFIFLILFSIVKPQKLNKIIIVKRIMYNYIIIIFKNVITVKGINIIYAIKLLGQLKVQYGSYVVRIVRI